MTSIVFERDDYIVVNTGLPNANMMHDASRPFAVCKRIKAGTPGRVYCLGRYTNFLQAKRRVRDVVNDDPHLEAQRDVEARVWNAANRD